MGLFGPPNISKLTESHDIRGLIKALAYKDSIIQLKAMWAMADLKDSEFVEPLLRFAFTNINQSENALKALASIQDPRIVPPLLQLIKDFRKQSQFNTIESSFYDIYCNIIETLAAIGDPRIIPEMLYIFNNFDCRHHILNIGKAALIKFGEQSILPLLQIIDASPNKKDIIEIIAEVGTPRALEQLEALMASKNKAVRRNTAKCLKNINKIPNNKISFIHYSIATKDFTSVFNAGVNSIPILMEILQKEYSPTEKSPEKSDWEIIALIASTLIKLGDRSNDFGTLFQHALANSKGLESRKTVIDCIAELGEKYESTLISFANSFFENKNKDLELIVNFPKGVLDKMFVNNNSLLSELNYFIDTACRDDFNVDSKSAEKTHHARTILLELGHPYASNALLASIKDKSDSNAHYDSLKLSYATKFLMRMSGWNTNLHQDEIELVNSCAKRSHEYDSSRKFNYT